MRLTPEQVRELIIHDPETGMLWWKPRPIEMFTASRIHSRHHYWKAWNTNNAYQPALQYVGLQGYKRGHILRQPFKACWVIWGLSHGEWPKRLDHIDGEKSNDRLVNLRNVTQKINSRNSKRFSTNKSGVTGVCFHKETGKWRAYIVVDYKQQHLGLFDLKDDAIAVRKAAEPGNGFHANHGREGPPPREKGT